MAYIESSTRQPEDNRIGCFWCAVIYCDIYVFIILYKIKYLEFS